MPPSTLPQMPDLPQGSSSYEHASLTKESNRGEAEIHRCAGGSSLESGYAVTVVANKISLLGLGGTISDQSGAPGALPHDAPPDVDGSGGSWAGSLARELRADVISDWRDLQDRRWFWRSEELV